MDPSQAHNPYQSPPPSADFASGELQSGVAQSTIEVLRKTRPWVLVMACLGGFGAVMLIVLGIVVGTVGFGGGGMNDMPPGLAVGIAVTYVVMGLLYLVPTIFLFRFASRIKTLANFPSVDRLDSALAAQKSFWKYLGILFALLVVGYLAFIAIAIVFGFASNA